MTAACSSTWLPLPLAPSRTARRSSRLPLTRSAVSTPSSTTLVSSTTSPSPVLPTRSGTPSSTSTSAVGLYGNFGQDNYSTAKGVKNRIAKIFDFDEERAIYPANNQESLNDIMSNILTSPRHGSLTGSVPTRRAWTRLRCTDCQVTTTPE
ncbi:unnamed protein product [Tilletia laevis]|nr:unnamed protein product [Tilletia laevis]CAD6981160.1 unnamed protein product [Tilletia controversa]